MSAAVTPEQAIAATRAWVEKLVIGLNLCPFAAFPFQRNAIRYVVCADLQPEQVAQRLLDELNFLAEADPAIAQTTLLILTGCFEDFLDFNDFLDVAEAIVEEAELGGTLQVASFHPQYRFADETESDVSHWTNRSPYPVLHLIREDDIERAVHTHPDIDSIPNSNIRRLRELGLPAVEALFDACRAAKP